MPFAYAPAQIAHPPGHAYNPPNPYGPGPLPYPLVPAPQIMPYHPGFLHSSSAVDPTRFTYRPPVQYFHPYPSGPTHDSSVADNDSQMFSGNN